MNRIRASGSLPLLVLFLPTVSSSCLYSFEGEGFKKLVNQFENFTFTYSPFVSQPNPENSTKLELSVRKNKKNEVFSFA